MTWNDVNAIILRVLRRWWIVLGIVAIVVGATFWGLSSSLDRYQSTTLMVVGPNVDMEPSEVLRVADLLGSNMVMSTYADVMSSPKVVASGMVEVDPARENWSDFEVRVVQEPDSNVLRMIVEGPDAATTASLAAAVQSNGQEALAELFPIYSISPLDAGAPQAYLISLPWVRTIGISVVIGLGLGVLLALWFDSLLAYRQSSLGVINRADRASSAAVESRTAAYTRR
ncbi:MAG TPA: Wzz/FepE/Etk N-terminal domain-containing protein [Thermomicrobiales bacterium]|nr:Wzz/FepE/Etk N-terminal domain-containing protein [Thermomicrobiales bacterium]